MDNRDRACSESDPPAAVELPPFRGGMTGGDDADAERAVSSFGTGLFDLDRRAAVPLARRSQLGLDFAGGFGGSSEEERGLLKEVSPAEEGVGDRVGLATSAYDALPRGDGRSAARLAMRREETPSVGWLHAFSTQHHQEEIKLTSNYLP